MSRYVVQAGWDDVPHLNEQAKADLEASYLPHERDARRKGIPGLGEGAIYPVPEKEVVCKPFPVPEHFARAYGFDVGWKKTAGIWGAWDRDNDIIYCYSEHYRGQAEPSVHASAVKARGEWIPGIIDTAARGRSQTDGRRLWDLYIQQGLQLYKANKAVEAGILEVYQRLSTGRLKFFSTLQYTIAEYLLYHRNEKGLIVKEDDHLMDALRYLCMGIKQAITKPVQQHRIRTGIADSTAGY
ncbi:hypothetical protein NX722_28435 [Endozoicomonas gorgoniicola]|uniref:Terminase large subunit gp17-like C-terminal domain-containing protein n=1 Tax=Endozoicomonas gorgoniicola TaxID=1234144 RepID=A0ABT3N4E8_9GAMM|nr:hypothetical protein [Endozoicomonas gorgoniicola]MCW7556495.1 hypothetical protein [Endozoicomonas gorgoniicola]